MTCTSPFRAHPIHLEDADYELPRPMRGSSEWSERILELIARDDMSDFKELCDLMGVPD